VLIGFKAIIGVRRKSANQSERIVRKFKIVYQFGASSITKFNFQELRSVRGTERLSVTQLPVFETVHLLAVYLD
jgi:hypothetical protein